MDKLMNTKTQRGKWGLLRKDLVTRNIFWKAPSCPQDYVAAGSSRAVCAASGMGASVTCVSFGVKDILEECISS
jgi:hypothetical protein